MTTLGDWIAAFWLGVAMGSGQPLATTAERLSALAATWPGTRS